MPAARSNRDRILQIARWLAVTFPPPYPTTVHCVQKIAAEPGSTPRQKQTGDDGICTVKGRKAVIRIAIRRGIPRSSAIGALLHEWAHALLADRDSDYEGGHDAAWGRTYARVYRKFIDKEGCKASEDY